MPGMIVLPCRSITRVAGPVCGAIAAFGPTARMRSPAIAIACAIVNVGSTVMILPFLRMRSAAMVAGAAGACAIADEPEAAAAVAAPARKDRKSVVQGKR